MEPAYGAHVPCEAHAHPEEEGAPSIALGSGATRNERVNRTPRVNANYEIEVQVKR